MVREAWKAIRAGTSPAFLARQWSNFTFDLSPWSRPCDDLEHIKHVALLTSHGDEDIASAVTEALWEAGTSGIVEISEAHGRVHEVVTKRGYRLDAGPDSTDSFKDEENDRILEVPLIALLDDHLTEVSEVQSLLEEASAHDRPLVIVSKGCYGEALKTILMNDRTLKNGQGNVVQWVPLKPGRVPPEMLGHLEDLASLSGATVAKTSWGSWSPDWFGSVQQVRITRDSSVWVCFEDDATLGRLESRIKRLGALHDASEFPGDRDKIARRRALLADGFVQIRVGCSVLSERREKTSRIEDALGACRQAMETGLVPGGGQAYALAASQTSCTALREALMEPWRVLTPEPWKSLLAGSLCGWEGHLGGGVIGDLYEARLYDVAGVAKTVIETSISAAVSILNTAVAIHPSQ